jgi:hypothetical protein
VEDVKSSYPKPPWRLRGVRDGRKQFFFEKKNQKTFVPWRTRCRNAYALITKVFCFFSSEKKAFPSLPRRVDNPGSSRFDHAAHGNTSASSSSNRSQNVPATLRILCAVVFAAPLSVPAAAQTLTTKVTGIVGANTTPGTDIDTLGLFGPAGANLNGLTMHVTITFDASVMSEGGASPGYSAWSGPSGTCAVTVNGVRAKPSIEALTNINTNRIYFYSDYQGTWELSQDTEATGAPDTCGLTVSSTKHAFVPSAALVQSFNYKVPRKEQTDDIILLDITVNGVRETVTADAKSLKYGD